MREKDHALQSYTANAPRDAAINVCSHCTKVNDLLSTEVFTPDPALSLMNRIASECSGKFAMRLALHRGDIVIGGKCEDPYLTNQLV